MFKGGEERMIKLDAEQIVAVVFALVGEINAHGETYADMNSRENQTLLTHVIDALVWEIVKNTKFAKRKEDSMNVIGEDAEKFLRYLVEEYSLNDYVRKE